MDSPAANAAFAKQANISFPLLSDMNHKMLTSYGILKGYDVQKETYQWAQRANIVIDKEGIIRLIDNVKQQTNGELLINLHLGGSRHQYHRGRGGQRRADGRRWLCYG